VGIVEQINYKMDGSLDTKHWITHNQTFTVLEHGKSVNNLMDMTQYPPMIYGFSFLRMIHQAISMRHHFPNKRILCFLMDYKSAYRRLHYTGEAAQRASVYWDGYLYIWLHLTFGGASNPPAWCAISEVQTDLSNDILADTSWKIEDLSQPSVPDVKLPMIEQLEDDITFRTPKPTMVLPPPREFGSSEVFLDNVNTLVVDLPNACQ
jgi:hypothetical protein